MADRCERIIRASEIGQYAFCSRAWWLGSIKGLQSENQEELTEGKSAHAQHGHTVAVALALTRLAYAALLLAAAAGILWLIGRLII